MLRPLPQRRGVALIITLAILTILSILLIGFVLSTRQDRGASQNYGDSLRADQLALGGLDTVVASLRAEVADTRLSSNFPSAVAGFTNYFPLAPTNAVPQRTVTNAAALYPLIKVSGGPSYLTSSGPAAPVPSSGALSTNASLNNRKIALSRWNKPQLLSAAQAASFPSPQWVVVSRKGPFSPSSTSPSTAGATVGLSSDNEVLGRYAYAVYDLDGLLDVDVAGYPSGITTPGAKGPLPWADLNAVTNVTGFLAIPALRNAASAGNAASYGAYVTNWAASGYLTIANGDTSFLSRQELIRYSTNNPSGTDFGQSLPSLTVFSRELNGPTWIPSQPPGVSAGYNYVPAAAFTGAGGQTNYAAMAVRVATGGWTRNNGIAAVAGEPLVKYRFPLAKLALLENTPTAAGVAQYFGLDRAADSTGYYRHWTYPTASGTYQHTQTTRILRLDEVAALNREPDFFELLKAAILSGSLNLQGRQDSGITSGSGPETMTDAQIVQIGANIIDQWDADSYPTRITFNAVDFYGVEDLPYVNEVYFGLSSVNANTPPDATKPGNAYLYFGLWNPHQPSPAPAPTGGIPPVYVGALFGTYSLQYVVPGTSSVWNVTSTPNLPTYAIPFSPTAYRYPAAVRTNTFSGTGPVLIDATVMPEISGDADTAGGQILAYDLTANLAANVPAGAAPPATGSSATWASGATGGTPPAWSVQLATLKNAVFAVQFADSTGTLHPYGIAAGVCSNNAYANGGGFSIPSTATLVLTNTGTIDASSLVKADPRTSRFGLSWVQARGAGPYPGSPLYNVDTSLNPAGTAQRNASAYAPTNSAGTAMPQLYQLANNTNAAAVTYKDPDGLARKADYWGTAGNPYAATIANPDPRPVVLNRPFTSPGDLGYVFRDLPWKTLDFSSETSADTALLDYFTVAGGSSRPTVSGHIWAAAGKVSPNALQYAATGALLSGAWTDPAGGSTLSVGTATNASAALFAMVSNGFLALTNRADLANRTMTNSAILTGLGSPATKGAREAFIRALAESANTRTWNFLVDIVAQTGHYPPTASSFDAFAVTGERRYWLHVAIDRYTGEIVDEQLEAVSE